MDSNKNDKINIVDDDHMVKYEAFSIIYYRSRLFSINMKMFILETPSLLQLAASTL